MLREVQIKSTEPFPSNIQTVLHCTHCTALAKVGPSHAATQPRGEPLPSRTCCLHHCTVQHCKPRYSTVSTVLLHRRSRQTQNPSAAQWDVTAPAWISFVRSSCGPLHQLNKIGPPSTTPSPAFTSLARAISNKSLASTCRVVDLACSPRPKLPSGDANVHS